MVDYNKSLDIVIENCGKPDNCKEFDECFTFIFNPKSDDVFDKGLIVDVMKNDGRINYPNMFDIINRGKPSNILDLKEA